MVEVDFLIEVWDLAGAPVRFLRKRHDLANSRKRSSRLLKASETLRDLSDGSEESCAVLDEQQDGAECHRARKDLRCIQKKQCNNEKWPDQRLQYRHHGIFGERNTHFERHPLFGRGIQFRLCPAGSSIRLENLDALDELRDLRRNRSVERARLLILRENLRKEDNQKDEQQHRNTCHDDCQLRHHGEAHHKDADHREDIHDEIRSKVREHVPHSLGVGLCSRHELTDGVRVEKRHG